MIEKQKSGVDQTLESLLCSEGSPLIGLEESTSLLLLSESDKNLKSTLTGLTKESTDGPSKHAENKFSTPVDFKDTSNFLNKSHLDLVKTNDCK